MDPDSQRWFRITCCFELALLFLALIIARLARRSWFGDFHWDFEDALWGISATVPLLVVFLYGLQSLWKPFAEMRGALDRTLGHVFKTFSVIQLLVVSA